MLKTVCLQVVRSLVLTVFFFGFLALPQGAFSAPGKKSAPKNSASKESAAGKAQEAQQKAARSSASARPAARAAENKENDPDLPAFLRGKIDKQTYLQLRAEYIGRIRGIDLNHPPDPHLRMNAIRTMEQQEQQIYGNRNASAAPGTIAPFSPPSPTWGELGPRPFPNAQVQSGPEVPGSGRISAIAVHPTNPNIVYVGAAQGGVYRSLDGGATWTALTDSALSLSIGAIAIAPSQPSTIYIGTGEANLSLDSFFGVGVYRIDNADTSPVLVGPLNLDAGSNDIFTGRSISKILVDPANANNIFVASSSGASGLDGGARVPRPARGIYRSTNALAAANTVTFARLGGATGPGPNGNRIISDIVFEPGNTNNLLAFLFDSFGTGDGGVYRTTNATAADPTTVTFAQTLSVAPSLGGSFAINKVGSTVTVLVTTDETDAACFNTTGNGGMLRESIDGGVTFPTTISAGSGFCGGQCFYDKPVAMDPANAGIIYVAGSADSDGLSTTPRALSACQSTTFAKSTDGATFNIQDGSLHADAHAIAIAPSNSSIVYFGNDGGIFKSTNGGGTWSSINTNGFGATQFQSLALHPTDRNFMIGGTQDNGTPMMRADGSWFRADFGDGGYSLIDQNATDTTNVVMYHTYFNQTQFRPNTGLLGFARTQTAPCATEGEWSFMGIYPGVVDPTVHCDGTTDSFNGISITDSVLFYAPIARGPGSPNTVYYGSDRLYRSTNKGTTMTVVSQAPIAAGVPISTIAISPQNDNVRVVGLANGKLFGTTAGSSTLTDITGSTPGFYPARALIDPNNQNTAYVTFDDYGVPAGQHVWKTTNLNGAPPVWTASGSGIPDVPVNSIVIDPANSNAVYVATDIGVYYSADGGTTWNPYGIGLPRVACFDIAIQSSNHVLRVATHGRGIWEIPTAGSLLSTATSVLSSPNPSVFGQSVTFTTNVGPGVATGSVQIQDGGTNVGAAGTLSGGTATISISTLGAGTRNITAVYSGDTSHSGSTGSLPTQTVNRASTITVVASSQNPSTFPAAVTFTATLSAVPPGGGTPTGTVTFMDGATVLGAATLSAGSASFTTNALSIGSHNITGVYGGDTNFTASTSSPPLAQVVNGTTTLTADISVTVTHSPNNPVIQIGGKLAITVTVTNNDATNPATVALNLGTISGPLEVDSVVPPSGATCNPPSNGTIQCSIPVLAHSSNAVFTVNVRPLRSDVRTLTAIAAEASNTTDPTTTDNTANDTIKVRFKPFRK